jgi:glycerol-3-phosphate dehydrogenase (NAD(P)+)
MTTAVIGTTSWGTTLAVLLARGGNETLLWARSEAEAAALTAAGENAKQRPGLRFPGSLRLTAADSDITAADMVVIAVPSAGLRANLERLAGSIAPDATVLSAVKGIEPETSLRMSEVIEGFGVATEHILVLSGPNFAGEIAAGLPAATVIAGRDQSRAQAAQVMLNSATFRVYTSDDPAGVEIGGALKNVIAIACGLSDGLGYGENAKAALITRGLAEITRLGVAAGANALTFLGLAGLGDLVLTCGSDISRNRRLGLALAGGASLAEALASIDGVVEGAVTARALPGLARRYGVEMPICAALHAVLYAGKPAREAGQELMARAAKAESG